MDIRWQLVGSRMSAPQATERAVREGVIRTRDGYHCNDAQLARVRGLGLHQQLGCTLRSATVNKSALSDRDLPTSRRLAIGTLAAARGSLVREKGSAQAGLLTTAYTSPGTTRRRRSSSSPAEIPERPK